MPARYTTSPPHTLYHTVWSPYDMVMLMLTLLCRHACWRYAFLSRLPLSICCLFSYAAFFRYGAATLLSATLFFFRLLLRATLFYERYYDMRCHFRSYAYISDSAAALLIMLFCYADITPACSRCHVSYSMLPALPLLDILCHTLIFSCHDIITFIFY